VEQLLDLLGREQHLDHARPVVGERRVDRLAAAEVDELARLGVGEGVGIWSQFLALARGVRPCTTRLGTELAQIRKLHVRPGLHLSVIRSQ